MLAIFCIGALILTIGAFYYFLVIKHEGDDDGQD